MDYRALGNSGLSVSRLCLGCMSFGSPMWRPWILSEDESMPIIRAAIEAGVNFFDTANIYSNGASEIVLGNAIRRYSRRADVFVMTKVGLPLPGRDNIAPLSKLAIAASLDESLNRLGTDYVDAYLLHRFDYSTPLEETLEALDSARSEGKVRAVGASSMYASQFSQMLSSSDRLGFCRHSIMQLQYNLVYREEEREMVPLCQSEDVGIVAWAPLARGFLGRARSSSSRRFENDTLTPEIHNGSADALIRDAVKDIADERAISPAEVALAWVLQKPWIASASIGVTHSEQLTAALKATTTPLSTEEMRRLEAPYIARPILDHR